MPSESNTGRKGKRKRKPAGEENASSRRAGLLISIASGVGLGAFIGILVGYLLGPRSRTASASERGQALKAWREMVRKLSEQLQIGGTR